MPKKNIPSPKPVTLSAPKTDPSHRLAAAYVILAIVGVSVATYVTTAAVTTAPKTTKTVLPKKAPVTKLPRPAVSAVSKKLDSIRIKIPKFDLSASPVPALKISPFNLSMPQLPGKGMFKNFGADKDIGYKGGAVKIDMPQVDISKYMPTDIPAGGPPTSVPAAPSGTAPPETPPSSGSAPAQSQVSPSNCAQFTGIPSCSYVGDPNGKTLCEQCKAAGY